MPKPLKPAKPWLVVALTVAAVFFSMTGHTALAAVNFVVLLCIKLLRLLAKNENTTIAIPAGAPEIQSDTPKPVLEGGHYIMSTAASRLVTRMAIAQYIIAEHAAELTTRRKQLTATLSYGIVDDSKWQQDVTFFIGSVMINELSKEPSWNIHDPLGYSEIFEQMIESATAHYKFGRQGFEPDMDPVSYEQLIADSLSDLGWQTRTTKSTGDQGIDVIAEMRGERVVIQCKRYSSAIGNGAVQEAYAGRAFASADYAAVVTNAGFTRSARQLAEVTRVILLHHDDLSQLELRVFGAVSPSPRACSDARGIGAPTSQVCSEIVKEHADQLAILRKHLTVHYKDERSTVEDEGLTCEDDESLTCEKEEALSCESERVEDSQWLSEVAYFINRTIAPATSNIAVSVERNRIAAQMIDAATRHYPSVRVPLLLDLTPGLYEQAVADELKDLGWTTRLTDPGLDNHFDVIAEKGGKRVCIHCTGFFPSICESDVKHLDRIKSRADASHAVVISDAGFSQGVREGAKSSGVILLRHDNLKLLDERVFDDQRRAVEADVLIASAA